VGKPEGKSPRVRQRRRWENMIRIYLREIGMWGGFIGFGKGQVAGSCEPGDVPACSAVTELVVRRVRHALWK
jgi:hypothetical protein